MKLIILDGKIITLALGEDKNKFWGDHLRSYLIFSHLTNPRIKKRIKTTFQKGLLDSWSLVSLSAPLDYLWLSLGHAVFSSHLILLGDIKEELLFWQLHQGGRCAWLGSILLLFSLFDLRLAYAFFLWICIC